MTSYYTLTTSIADDGHPHTELKDRTKEVAQMVREARAQALREVLGEIQRERDLVICDSHLRGEWIDPVWRYLDKIRERVEGMLWNENSDSPKEYIPSESSKNDSGGGEVWQLIKEHAEKDPRGFGKRCASPPRNRP